MSEKFISATTLYNYIQCPHRVWLDNFGDHSKRDTVSPFVEMLWKRGNAFEKEVIESTEEVFLNLKDEPLQSRMELTKEAMNERQPR